MSTTAIMPQNSMFEFGDSFLKNDVNASDPSNTLQGLSSAVRVTLSRMASTPISSANVTMCLMSLTNHQHQNHRRLERAQSAPSPGGGLVIGGQQQGGIGGGGGCVSAAAAALSATSLNTSRYKTELCRPFEENGTCKYGDKCQFAHGFAELRSLARHPKYKTEKCRTYHSVGICPYGPRCHFVHRVDGVLQNATASPVGVTSSSPVIGGNVTTATTASMIMAAAAALNRHHQQPSALSPSSIDSSTSPTCSLSQSPTSSLSSFFSSEPDINSPSILDDQRLPVFNRLATNGNSLFATFSELKLE